jgi:hypothetical protein
MNDLMWAHVYVLPVGEKGVKYLLINCITNPQNN